ncbi:MAG: hypothetical protein IIC75_05495, partial [Bacteroidetes bacterium]|nr:hypothetical protein [Bacteroidota bacterium]
MNGTKYKIKEAFQKWFNEIYIPFTIKRPERRENFETVSFEKADPLYSFNEDKNKNYSD